MSHVTHMNESCHTYEWVMSHIWMSHVTHMKESCHTYEWAMSHIWMSHATRMNESCHTSYMNVSCHAMSRTCAPKAQEQAVGHVTHINLFVTAHPWMNHGSTPIYEVTNLRSKSRRRELEGSSTKHSKCRMRIQLQIQIQIQTWRGIRRRVLEYSLNACIFFSFFCASRRDVKFARFWGLGDGVRDVSTTR